MEDENEDESAGNEELAAMVFCAADASPCGPLAPVVVDGLMDVAEDEEKDENCTLPDAVGRVGVCKLPVNVLGETDEVRTIWLSR